MPVNTVRLVVAAILWVVSTAAAAFPCSTSVQHDPKAMVATADLILRVRAVEYFGPPPTPGRPNGRLGIPDSNVQFLVEEIVKGSYDKPNIALPGVLVESDEWNRQ